MKGPIFGQISGMMPDLTIFGKKIHFVSQQISSPEKCWSSMILQFYYDNHFEIVMIFTPKKDNK